ncbi:MAG: hypothetical protein KatS3mg002_1646 [Candidatus Woesearchaeota archaeon]|nr:MAG: hypothetical protein KatS3mg002_1646 [Candidatus Woesearchaeota archaeon]
MSINQEFVENSSLIYSIEGNLSSVKISGSVLGNGSVKILLIDQNNNSKIVFDSNSFNKKNNLLTGYAVEDIEGYAKDSSENNLSDEILENKDNQPEVLIDDNQDILDYSSNESNTSVNESIEQSYVEQSNVIEENINYTNEYTNKTTNYTEFINQSEEIELIENISQGYDTNYTENVSQSAEFNQSNENETIINNYDVNLTETLNEIVSNESVFFNETEINLSELIESNYTEFNYSEYNLTESNNTELNNTITERILYFDNYCLETCNLYNYGNDIILKIIVENAVLNLSSIEYSYYVEILNETLNQSINLTLNETLNLSLNLSLNQSINISMEQGVVEVNYSAKINEAGFLD